MCRFQISQLNPQFLFWQKQFILDLRFHVLYNRRLEQGIFADKGELD